MAIFNYQPADIADFSGGMTDNYLNAKPSQTRRLENFRILPNDTILTRPGRVLENALFPQVPDGSLRVGALINYKFDDHLFSYSGKKIYHRNPTALSYLTGPSGNNAFDVGDANSNLSHTQWNGHLMIANDQYVKPQKIFKDNTGTYQLRTAGLPGLATDPVITPSVAGANEYVYYFHYSCTYWVDQQTFKDAGFTTQLQLTGSDAPEVNQNNISSIPVLANGLVDNYDTASVKIEIYRTINGGTVGYKLGEVSNGTTTFVDNVSDLVLQETLETVYTNGGIPDNDQPPKAKYIHTVGEFTYYANFQEGAETFKNKIRQSQGYDPDSVPIDFEDEVEDEIIGLSSVKFMPIVLCKKHIYRIEGNFDELGRGGMRHIRIHDTAGCVSASSCVVTDDYLIWAGIDGFYATDGYKVLKISNHLNTTYKAVTASITKTKIQGVYDPEEKLAIFAVAENSGSEPDTLWIFDLTKGLSDEAVTFFWNGGENFYVCALARYNGTIYCADRFGFIYLFNEDQVVDDKADPLVAVTSWVKETIMYNYESVASNFGSSFLRKIAAKILLTISSKTNVSVQVTAINDDGKSSRDLTPIRYRKNFVWGDEEFVWGDPGFSWTLGGMIEEWRWFKNRALRFNWLQIKVSNAFTNIVFSDLWGKATVNSSLKTVTLDNAATTNWPADSVDYQLFFEFDGYAKGYKVTQRSDDTVTVEDVSNGLMSGSWKWELKGYKKGEVLNLLGYTIHWAPTTKSHTTYAAGDAGGNA